MPRYDPLIKVSAQRELYSLPREERNALRRVLKNVARKEQPSHHAKAKSMAGFGDLFRVRVGDVRAVCVLRSPHLLILRCGKRNGMYDDIDEIEVPDSAGAIRA